MAYGIPCDTVVIQKQTTLKKVMMKLLRVSKYHSIRAKTRKVTHPRTQEGIRREWNKKKMQTSKDRVGRWEVYPYRQDRQRDNTHGGFLVFLFTTALCNLEPIYP